MIPVEHQQIATDDIPAIAERHAAGLPELGVLRDSDCQWYLRQEKDGLILGPYEKGAPACYVDNPHPDMEYELFQEDLERLEPHIEGAIDRVPAFGEVGVKQVYNGAIVYTPDGNPIVDPAWDLPNFWLSEGHSFGITAAGGAGWQLAEWIVEGEPTIDMLGVDPRRYGDYCTKSYLVTKNEEAYEHVFITHYPDEERPACRPLRRTPIYDRLKNLGAVFGQSFGWERANFYAPEGKPQEDDWFVANKLPRKVGRLGLAHSLGVRGGVHSEYTVLREEPDYLTGHPNFYIVSAGAFQRLDHDWIRKHLPADSQNGGGSARFDNLTNSMGVLVVVGPKSRELMKRVAPGVDFSNAAFPWLSSQRIDVGYAPCRAARVNFVGELGWELHHPIEYQVHIFDKLMVEGTDLGLMPFGIRAMDSLRVEKSYRLPGQELSIEYAALESGLDRFVHLNKGDFLGRAALGEWQERGFANAFVTLEVHDTTDADALGSNPILQGGETVGRCTSGNYGFRARKSLALAMVFPGLSKVGTKLEIDILGTRHRCTVIEESPYDPTNEKLRADG